MHELRSSELMFPSDASKSKTDLALKNLTSTLNSYYFQTTMRYYYNFFSFFLWPVLDKIGLVDIMNVLWSILRLWTCFSVVACGFILALSFLRNYFAEVFYRWSPKWHPSSSSYSPCYVVPPVTLFMRTTSKQRSPISHLKRCVLISFVYFFQACP